MHASRHARVRLCATPSAHPLLRAARGLARIAGLALVVLCAQSLTPSVSAQTAPPPETPPSGALQTAEGFLLPHPNPQFRFPRDHGSHPGFKIEWWYLTGHLQNAQKTARYGFQATFFRRATLPPAVAAEADAAAPEKLFRAGEVYLFHAALSDLQTGKFHHTERLARAGWDAVSSTETLDVRVGANRLHRVEAPSEKLRLHAHIADRTDLSVDLLPKKPLVVFGEEGVSRKGDAADAASWYLTFPRMEVQGNLRLGDTLHTVTGTAWMDHEISSSQLTADQAGWDWAGIQLDDGREIMVYRLRRKDGGTDPASALFWVGRDARTQRVGAQSFRWEGAGTWRSPRSAAAYPLPVRLTTPDPESGTTETLVLEPLLADQELEGTLSGVPYWEGACRVLKAGKPVGSAYVELTGYSGALGRALK